MVKPIELDLNAHLAEFWITLRVPLTVCSTLMSDRILLIEDDPDDRALAERELLPLMHDAQLVVASNAESLRRIVHEGPIAVVVTDLSVAWSDGFAIVEAVREQSPDACAILFALSGSEEQVVDAIRRGFDDYVPKSMPHRVRLCAAVSAQLRRQSERSARIEAEQRYRTLFQHVPIGVFRTTPSGEILASNPAVAQMLGYEVDELESLNVASLYVNPNDREAWKARLAAEEVVLDFELPLRHRDGRIVWTRRNARAVRDEHGVIRNYEGTIEDITLQKAMEMELQAREQRFRSLIESSTDVTAIVDGGGVIRYVAPAVTRIFGYAPDDLVGRSMFELIHSDELARVHSRFADLVKTPNGVHNDHIRIWHKDGTLRLVDITSRNLLHDAAINGIVANTRDITDGYALQQQLIQAQKMEAVGRLAGGIAHDFNNLLTAISGHAQLALAQVPLGNPIRPDLEEINKSAQRAAALTRQLLAFSRRQVLQPKVLDLNTVVREVDSMLRRVIGEDVELTLKLRAVLPNVLGDPGQLEQVLVNLCVNARDAMPEGGRIVVETYDADVDSARDLEPGRYVVLAVTDGGTGIDPEVLPHIFEPFYTTKEVGRGTGLGLSTVHGIVTQSGGDVQVETGPTGTTFRIF